MEQLFVISKKAKDSPAWGVILVFLLFTVGMWNNAFLNFLFFAVMALVCAWAAGWVLYEFLAGGVIKPLCLLAMFLSLVVMFFYGTSTGMKEASYLVAFAIYAFSGVLGWVSVLRNQGHAEESKVEKKNSISSFVDRVSNFILISFAALWPILGLVFLLTYFFGE